MPRKRSGHPRSSAEQLILAAMALAVRCCVCDADWLDALAPFLNIAWRSGVVRRRVIHLKRHIRRRFTAMLRQRPARREDR